MSTGSIKHNIEITDSADAERFVEALEKAKAESEEGMERLTYRTHPSKDVYLAYGLDAIWRKKLKKLRYDIITNAVDRLAAYEDTGLTPEQIQEQQRYIKALEKQVEVEGQQAIIEAQQQEIEQLADETIKLMRENAQNSMRAEYLAAEKDELIELLKAARSRLPNAMRFCVCGKCKSCGEQIPYTNHIYCDHCLIILIDKVIGGKEDV